MGDAVPTFHWADYLVLGVFLASVTLIGLIIGFRDRKKATSKEFLMGGGDMHYIPVALSMQASFLSSIFILSTPTEIYYFGTMYTYMAVSYFIGIPIAAYMYLPTFHKLRLTSAYEYLERRFNRPVRLAGALTFALMVILYMAVVLYSPAIALAQVTGLSEELSISLCGAVCVIYTVLGGMKATIWNDFIQMVIIIVGLLILVIKGAIDVNGNFWTTADKGGRIVFDNFDPDPTIRTTFWTQTVGGTFMNLTLYASSQTIIQKFLSVKKLKNAQKSMWVATLTSTLFMVLVALVGLVMYAYYVTCDPIRDGKVAKSDQMVPLFIMEVLGDLPGLPGLLIAATFSAALSSISGSLNALAAVFLVDFIRPIYFKIKKEAISERASNIISRCLALGFGIFTIVMGFIAKFFGDLILQMALSIFGFVGGPLNALLSLGLFLPFINSWGAMAGLLSSLGICCWIAIGAIVEQIPVPKLPTGIEGCPVEDFNFTTGFSTFDYPWTTADPPSDPSYLWVYKLSHMYYSVIAMIVAVVVGIVVSLITGRAKNTDSRLTFQWGKNCCCYCPRSIRDCLRCGATEYDDDDDDSSDDENDSSNITKDPSKDEAFPANGIDNIAVIYSSDEMKDPSNKISEATKDQFQSPTTTSEERNTPSQFAAADSDCEKTLPLSNNTSAASGAPDGLYSMYPKPDYEGDKF